MIPAEAVEAAHKAWREQGSLPGSIFEYNLQAALEAAAPHIIEAARSEREHIDGLFADLRRMILTARLKVTLDKELGRETTPTQKALAEMKLPPIRASRRNR